MKKNILLLTLFIYFTSNLLNAQEPLSFFPHNVDDRWDYYEEWGGQPNYFSLTITRDSIGNDSSHSIFYNNELEPRYKIDTLNNVFQYPNNNFQNYLRYKLDADSGAVWTVRPFPNFRSWAWVAYVESAYVFSQPTVIKIFRYSPGHPDSTTVFLEEDWLASGFGLIYHWQEPNDFTSLLGCIIEGDTFGNITNVEQHNKSNIITDYQLKQNYPNPFNPVSKIKFSIPRSEVVQINVYDVLGKEIKTLLNEYKQAGTYEIEFDATSLPSGVYFYRMISGGYAETKKMLLLR